MPKSDPQPWKISLHGGHSGDYCDHAQGKLRDMLDAAVAAGFRTFGVSEHAPRSTDGLLYQDEIEMGWGVSRLERNFDQYARDLAELASEFDDRITILRGFETEAAPAETYKEEMLALREKYEFEYMVGSVHHINDVLIDGPPEDFQVALDAAGTLNDLALAYYESVTSMIRSLKPEVVAHLDLIRKNAPRSETLDSPPIRRAAEQTLEAVREHGGILDVNTAGYRKGLGSPYPAPWLVQTARKMDIPFCFGDDSHNPSQVGAGIDDARAYLLENGVTHITTLARRDNAITRESIPLQ